WVWFFIMNKKKGTSSMLVSTLIMAALAVSLLVFGYIKGGGQHITGLNAAWKMMLDILPLLIFAMIVGSMVPILLPKELLVKWVGGESGIRGILVGSVAGALTPGGPFVSFPIAASLLRSGASISAMVAFITGWLIYSLSRLPLEVGILGWKFTLIRVASTFFFPPIAGLIAKALFEGK
ncbi:MAG: permease, partial [Nitrospinota bacterium]